MVLTNYRFGPIWVLNIALNRRRRWSSICNSCNNGQQANKPTMRLPMPIGTKSGPGAKTAPPDIPSPRSRPVRRRDLIRMYPIVSRIIFLARLAGIACYCLVKKWRWWVHAGAAARPVSGSIVRCVWCQCSAPFERRRRVTSGPQMLVTCSCSGADGPLWPNGCWRRAGSGEMTMAWWCCSRSSRTISWGCCGPRLRAAVGICPTVCCYRENGSRTCCVARPGVGPICSRAPTWGDSRPVGRPQIPSTFVATRTIGAESTNPVRT